MAIPDLLDGPDTQPRECDDTVLCVTRRLRSDARSEPFDEQTEPVMLDIGDEFHDAIQAEDFLDGTRREAPFRSRLRRGGPPAPARGLEETGGRAIPVHRPVGRQN